MALRQHINNCGAKALNRSFFTNIQDISNAWKMPNAVFHLEAFKRHWMTECAHVFHEIWMTDCAASRGVMLTHYCPSRPMEDAETCGAVKSSRS